jgi:hypothetical protein
MPDLESQLRAYGALLDAAEPGVVETAPEAHHRNRRIAIVSFATIVAIAIVASVVGVVASRSSAPTHPTVVTPPSGVATSASPTTRVPGSSTTATTPVPAVVPDATAMLALDGRRIVALDVTGHTLKTLVTVFAGRAVTNAMLASDRETIWYDTHAVDNQSCPEVVKLNLRTDARTVVAHAEDFTLSADGSHLLLVWPASDAAVAGSCRSAPVYSAALALRDLVSGSSWSMPVADFPGAGTGGPSGPVWLSDDGTRIVTTQCVVAGCTTHAWIVAFGPSGHANIYRGSGPDCGCSTLVTTAGGVYAIDRGTADPPQTRLLRYDPAHLSGAGEAVAAPRDVTLTTVVRADRALAPDPTVRPGEPKVFYDVDFLVVGLPRGSRTPKIYALEAGALQAIGQLDVPTARVVGVPAPPAAAGPVP